jgi:hypothetical protein
MMKRRFLFAIVAIVMVAVSGYHVYQAQFGGNLYSNLQLANIEALAQDYEFVITCGTSQSQGPCYYGKCERLGVPSVTGVELGFWVCHGFSGYMENYCRDGYYCDPTKENN